MFDDSLMLIDGDTDGSLTASGTYSGIEVDESPVGGFFFTVIAPAAAGTTPTLDIDIEQADTDANASYAKIASFTQMTAAGRQTVKALISKDYVRASVTTSGTSPDFGAVSLGITSAPHRFWNA